jgi:hypothetical protein
MSHRRYLVLAGGVLGAALLVAPDVLAQDQAHDQVGVLPPRRAQLEDTQQALYEDENGVPRKTHEPLFIGIDFMVGFGNYNVVESQTQPGTGSNIGYIFVPNIQVRTETFMLLAHYKFKNFGIGMRLPLIVGHISDANPGTETFGENVFNNGNLEFSLDTPRRLSPQVRYVPQVALTIPISSGSTPPGTQAELTNNTQLPVRDITPAQSIADQYDRYAVGIAAAMARGGEEDALFFPWRLGIVPKISFDMKFNHTKIVPYVKVPIMIDMENNVGDTAEPVRVEVVGGFKIAQEIGPVQLGVRVVGMIPIAARTTLKTPMLSVWPEARFQLTPSAQLWLAGMIPLAGDYNIFSDLYGNTGANGAFEAGIGASF